MQRVSDTVAILNHGRLVANGPIEELLAGGEGTVYSVTMKGAVDGAYERVIAQQWVQDIQAKSRNGATTWSVAVDNQEVAEASLLRLLLAEEIHALGRRGVRP